MLPAGCKPVGYTLCIPVGSTPNPVLLTPRGGNHGLRNPFPRAVCLVVRSTQMIQPAQSRSNKLRVFCAALFLLVGSIAGPIALATQIADSCGMACCVKEGQCCCSPHHASVKGQVSNSGARISEAEITTSCPQGCSTALRTSNTLLRDYLGTDPRQTFEDGPAALFQSAVAAVRDFVESGSYSPRAPPVFSI